MRPWIAMAAAFALALQILLGGVLASQAEAAGASPDSPFVICLGSDSSGPAEHGGSGEAPAKHLSCVLCTLAKSSSAILAADRGTAFDVGQLAAVVSRTAERVVQYNSPTGQYQRGPPVRPLAG
jgi:hypothetical protein